VIVRSGDSDRSKFLDRALTQAAEWGSWPYGVARLGVVLAVALILGLLPGAFRDAFQGNAHWTAHNAALSYIERSVPPADAVGSSKVAEDARLWMPQNARYRVVIGPNLSGPLPWSTPEFLTTFLLPRRQTGSADARWIFCVHCSRSQLNPIDVLSDSGDGIVFGRVNR
jgi:hypothetical protein